MNPIKIGVIGNGWRSQTFFKIIRELPNQLELKAVLFRNAQKASEFEQQYPHTAYTDLNLFLKQDFDFVLLALPREKTLEYLEKLLIAGVPVLCETPPANGLDELTRCWELAQTYHANVQVAEQYFLQPYHSAILQAVQSGMIGTVSNLMISMMHDYHGISMMRKLLGIKFECCQIQAESHQFPVTLTCNRDGMNDEQKIVTPQRKRAVFHFSGGKVGFFDFCDEQYFNYLRTRHLNVQGDRGEIWDQSVHYLNADGVPFHSELQRVDTGAYSNLEGLFHRGITLNGTYLYQNPFADSVKARLNDDEIAMATLLIRMKESIDTGHDCYSLADGLQDTYLYLMMDQAIQTGKTIFTQPQPWTTTR